MEKQADKQVLKLTSRQTYRMASKKGNKRTRMLLSRTGARSSSFDIRFVFSDLWHSHISHRNLPPQILNQGSLTSSWNSLPTLVSLMMPALMVQSPKCSPACLSRDHLPNKVLMVSRISSSFIELRYSLFSL